MPITAIVEFTAVEGEDPREGYDRVSRALNDGRPTTRRSEFGEGLLAHVHSVTDEGRCCRRRRLARPSPKWMPSSSGFSRSSNARDSPTI